MAANKYTTETLTVLAQQTGSKIEGINNRLQSVEKKIDIKFDTISGKMDSHSNKIDLLLHHLTEKSNNNETAIAILETKNKINIEDISQNSIDIEKIELITTDHAVKYNEFKMKKSLSSENWKKVVAIFTILGGIGTLLGATL